MKQSWAKPYITEINVNMTENGTVPKVGSCEDIYTNDGMGTGKLPHKK